MAPKNVIGTRLPSESKEELYRFDGTLVGCATRWFPLQRQVQLLRRIGAGQTAELDSRQTHSKKKRDRDAGPFMPTESGHICYGAGWAVRALQD